MKRTLLVGILIIYSYVASALDLRQGALDFHWDWKVDTAVVWHLPDSTIIWQGSLLPSFWLQGDGSPGDGSQDSRGRPVFVKGRFVSASAADSGGWVLTLAFGRLGRGQLFVSREQWGLRFKRLGVDWTGTPPAIIEMYFGASDDAVKASMVPPTWDRPFMPDWQALLYCIPGAKGGTPQSYFRMWDFGLANVALGNFGPSMGSPYGAAYPRPLLYAGMGSDSGFVVAGAGSIPDAAMSLRVQSARGCIQYVYDEQLWGAPRALRRVWQEPLRLSFGANAWLAFRQFYSGFPVRSSAPKTPKAFWNTWGEWRQKKYHVRPIIDFARRIGAGGVVMDGGWESYQGAGLVDTIRFPDFAADVDAAKRDSLGIGFWETVGWITDPFLHGLHKEDVICGHDGKPVQANWDFSPSDTGYYCIDISSPHAREWLKQRTIQFMRAWRPALIKLDFMYGLPAPYMGVPRDPEYRGERYGAALTKLIVAAARSVDRAVTIEGYGIGPLWLNDVDLVSLDDQGDLWYDIARGHQEWSIWASLLSDRHVPVCASSGYDWKLDDEVVLNTCILGVPGATLPIAPVADQYFNRRLAIDRWHRRSVDWAPLWLNSTVGGYMEPPELRCWGRLEGDSVLTALALRDGVAAVFHRGDTAGSSGNDGAAVFREHWMRRLRWKGRWGMISQDDKDIFNTVALAVIPFDPGMLEIALAVRPAAVSRLNKDGLTAFDEWQWADGWLTIRVSDELLKSTAGFLIKK